MHNCITTSPFPFNHGSKLNHTLQFIEYVMYKARVK